MLNFFTENGVVESTWYPSGTEKNFTMPVSLAPLMPVKEHVIVFEGLDQVASGSNGGGGHQRGKTRRLHRPGQQQRQGPRHLAGSGGGQPDRHHHPVQVHRGQRLRQGRPARRGLLQRPHADDRPRGRSGQAVRPPVLRSAAQPDGRRSRQRRGLRQGAGPAQERPRPHHGRVQAGLWRPWAAAIAAGWTAHLTAIRSLEQSLGIIDGGAAAGSMACRKPPEPQPHHFVDTGKAPDGSCWPWPWPAT